MNMLKIAIVEDDAEVHKSFKDFLSSYQNEIKEKIELTIFSDGLAFLEKANSHFDIVFMDIGLPFESGISIAKKLRHIDAKASIIFITALSQYAIDGYEVNAFAYLLKPLNSKILKMKLNKLLELRGRNKTKTIEVKNDGISMNLDLSTVTYIESNNHVCFFYTKDKKFYKVYSSIKNLEVELIAYGFVRVSGSYLINLAYLTKWSSTNVFLEGDIKIPLSRQLKVKFFKSLSNWKDL